MEAGEPLARPTASVILGSRLQTELAESMCQEGADAIVHLHRYHCCGRCILRLLCIRVVELYKQTDLVRISTCRSSILCLMKVTRTDFVSFLLTLLDVQFIQFFLRDYVAKFGLQIPPPTVANVNDLGGTSPFPVCLAEMPSDFCHFLRVLSTLLWPASASRASRNCRRPFCSN